MEANWVRKIVFQWISRYLYSEVSTGHLNRGLPKKQYKDYLEKSLGAYHINHYKQTTLAEDCDGRYFTTIYTISPFENTHRAPSRTKDLGGRNTTLHQPLNLD